MLTYKQDIKEKSRIKIWTKAIKNLTVDRDKQRILKPNYIRRLWDYAFDEILPAENPDEKYIESWTCFSNSLYDNKYPHQLKIAYFCGPEPENDLKIMTQLGVQIENVWAIESNKNVYLDALLSAKKKYPTLKIFNGDISNLIKIISFKFDIIYLDFTAPLFSKESKPLLTLNSIFESKSLSDLGILVVNSSIPDKTEENIEFLSSYFRSHAFLEGSIYTGNSKDSCFHDSADSCGYISRIEKDDNEFNEDEEIFENLIYDNFEYAYSAFSTHYPTVVAGYIQPMLRVGSIPTLKHMFIKKDQKQILSNLNIDEILENHEHFPIWNFILRLKDSKTKIGKYWYQQFKNCKKGGVSYFDSVRLYDLLRIAKYSYKDILSEDLSNSIDEIISALPDSNKVIFCDAPMSHLWIELAINHLGNAHHVNTDAHWRAKYKAKERDMYLDLFVFDNCRALYDWLPMLNLYGKDMSTIERQIIVRACMDAITKQNHYSSFFSYYGANLIGVGKKRWSHFSELKKRFELKI